MTSRTLTVISAGLSEPSSTRLLADQLAASAKSSLSGQGIDTIVETIELRDHAHDLMNSLLTGFPSGDLRAAIDSVVAADGLIAVTPIFNASYSGLFKSFFDVLETDSLSGKPALIAATGGTPRHSLALEHAMRPMFAYLRSIVVPTSVFAAAEDWGTGRRVGRALSDRIDRAGGDLASLVGDRPPAGPVDPFADATPFEQLLAGS